MQQLTLVEPGRVEWTDAPEPAIEGAGAGARAPARRGALRPRPPTIVTASSRPRRRSRWATSSWPRSSDVGDDVQAARPGDRVVVPFQISCGDCDRCRRGQTGDCDDASPRLSMYGFGALGGNWGGALQRPGAGAVRRRDAGAAARRASSRPPWPARATTSPTAGGRSRRPLERRPGAEVLVVGGGARSIALYAVDIALALGAAEVVYVDDDACRLANGRGAGRRDASRATPPDRIGPFPITVDGSRHARGPRTARCAPPSRAASARTSASSLEPETPMPLLEMYTNGLEFRIGRVMARPTIPTAARAGGGGQPASRAGHRAGVASWDDAADAVAETPRPSSSSPR